VSLPSGPSCLGTCPGPGGKAAGCWSRDPEAFSNPISIQLMGSVPSEWRSQFPTLSFSLPPPTSHPPLKPEERAGRHQRPPIRLPAANKTYLSLPAAPSAPSPGGTGQKDPPGPPPSPGRCPPRSSDQMGGGLTPQPPLWVPCRPPPTHPEPAEL